MQRHPDHRYRAMQAAVQEGDVPTEPRLAALYALLDDVPTTLTAVEHAYDIHQDEEHRCVLDAFLLTRCSPADLKDLLGIEADVVNAYGYLFMDMTVFRNKLEIISFAAHYVGTTYGQEIVKTAVQAGAEYLYWAYGKTRDDIDPRVIIRRTMLDSYFRGMAHKGNGLTTGIAKEAHKWWATAIRNAEITERMSPSTAKQAIEELRIALGQQDETTGPDDFDVPLAEILH